MGELRDLREAMKSAMQTAMPRRIVTRDLLDFSQRDPADLEMGVVTIIGRGEKDYANYLSRATQLGTAPMIVVGQIALPEDVTPSQIEDAEDLLAEEIKLFCRDPGDPLLGGITMSGFVQSGQTDAPYGWISCDIEVKTWAP